jgi:hypothetical protein
MHSKLNTGLKQLARIKQTQCTYKTRSHTTHTWYNTVYSTMQQTDRLQLNHTSTTALHIIPTRQRNRENPTDRIVLTEGGRDEDR